MQNRGVNKVKGIKIAVIGAGSTYTPELFDGFIKRKQELPVKSFYLMDIDRGKLDVVGGLAKRMLDKNNIDAKFVLTGNLEEAIRDADFVIAQIRVGKLDARVKDEKIPLKYNMIGQETTGIGGFMKGMRTIPVLMNIANFMEKYCPDAWLINFSNPSGMIAEALLNNTSVKTLGLCNGPIKMKAKAAGKAPEDSTRVYAEYVGLNHLSWITNVYCDGVDILQDQLNQIEFDDFKNIWNVKLDEELIKSVRGIPSPYLSYYYYHDKQLNRLKGQKKCRAEVCKEIETELLQLYRKPELDKKPEVLSKRGGSMYSEAAVSLISAIHNDKDEEHVVDVKNNGALDFMEDDDIVEVTCNVNKNGVFPVKVKDFNNEHVISMMKIVKRYEKHAVRASIYGDYSEALNAMLVHPLAGDYTRVKDALDELMEAHKKYLPQFYGN